jgi:pantothenate kinase
MSIPHAYDFYDEEYNPELDAECTDESLSYNEAERATEQLEYLINTMPHNIFSIFNLEGD